MPPRGCRETPPKSSEKPPKQACNPQPRHRELLWCLRNVLPRVSFTLTAVFVYVASSCIHCSTSAFHLPPPPFPSSTIHCPPCCPAPSTVSPSIIPCLAPSFPISLSLLLPVSFRILLNFRSLPMGCRGLKITARAPQSSPKTGPRNDFDSPDERCKHLSPLNRVRSRDAASPPRALPAALAKPTPD